MLITAENRCQDFGCHRHVLGSESALNSAWPVLSQEELTACPGANQAVDPVQLLVALVQNMFFLLTLR